MFKILSLDGGGIRSAFQARVITRLEAALGSRLAPDLYAGTSGGAIVSCGLQKLSPDEVLGFFLSDCPKIFRKESFFKEIDDLWNLKGAKYETKTLRDSLSRIFGEMTIGDLPSRTLLTSFSLKHPEGGWQPVVFHNFAGINSSLSLKVVDAILRSASAPTYFPVYQDHCDGGVWGNNPSMSAVAAACDELVGRQPISKVAVLSIGTGWTRGSLKGTKRDLGAIDWFQKGIMDVLLDGNVEASHYYTKSLLGPRYYRIQVELPHEVKLDDARNVSEMIACADAVNLQPILDWMEGFWIDVPVNQTSKIA